MYAGLSTIINDVTLVVQFLLYLLMMMLFLSQLSLRSHLNIRPTRYI